MRGGTRALGSIVRVLLCAATVLAILLWLLLAGEIWMSDDGLPFWPTLQFLASLAGQTCLLGAFVSADDGHRSRAARLWTGAAVAFLLWLVLVDVAGLWPVLEPAD
jgi:hypothetical protein